MTTAFRKVIFLVVLMICWEAASNIFNWGIYFPSFSQTAMALWTGFSEGYLWVDTWASMQRLLVAFLIAITLGTGLGLLFARVQWLDDTFGFLVVALQTIPSIAWLPFAIIWFGLNDLAVVFITTLGATWTMCLSARTGIKNIPPIYLKAAKTMGTASWPMFTQVMIPASFPHMINGLRVAWAFAWRALVAGELIARGAGLGHRMEDAKSVGAVETMLAVVLIIAVLGTLSDHLLFKRLEDRLLTRYGLKR